MGENPRSMSNRSLTQDELLYYMYFCGEYLEDHPSKWLVTSIYMSHECPFGRGGTPGLGELTITVVINHVQVME